MNSRELNDFKQLLELDDNFKTKVEEIEKMLIEGKNQASNNSVYIRQQDKSKPSVEKLNYKRSNYSKLNKIAIIIAIILALVSIWFFSTTQNKKLYTKYFKIYSGFSEIISNPKNLDFNDGLIKYKQGNYKYAIDKWTALSEQKPENDTLNYLLGVAYMANKNTSEAIPFLERSVEAPDEFVFLDNAYYYLGLAYLNEGNIELAIKNLSTSETKIAKEIILKLTD